MKNLVPFIIVGLAIILGNYLFPKETKSIETPQNIAPAAQAQAPSAGGCGCGR